MYTASKRPLYIKASLICIGLLAFVCLMYVGQRIIIPIIYAIIISIVMNPLVDFFVARKMSRILAISISLACLCLASIVFILLLSTQLNLFIESFPKLLGKFYVTLDNISVWVAANFNVSVNKIRGLIVDARIGLLGECKSSIGSTLMIIGNTMIMAILIPVYVFFISFYKPLLLDFVRRLFGVNNHKDVNEVLLTTKTIIQKYLGALLLEAVIIATLNSLSLIIIGIDYAVLLGVLGAIANIIPYIGGLIGVALPMIIAFTMKPTITYTVLVFGAYLLIQFVDNHYIIPKIVASKVKINALVSIIVVLCGGALWGVAGMFVSIPLTAIIKVIFDHIEPLKPWGFLLGDSMPTITIFKQKRLKNN